MERGILLAGLVLTVATPTACMDPLNDYGDCVKVETARCELRDACFAGFDLETCVAYYEEFCRTREIDGLWGKNASDAQVQACVNAIRGMYVSATENRCDELDDAIDETDLLPECGFLWPEEEEDASAGDTETGTGTDAPDAG